MCKRKLMIQTIEFVLYGETLGFGITGPLEVFDTATKLSEVKCKIKKNSKFCTFSSSEYESQQHCRHESLFIFLTDSRSISFVSRYILS